MHPNIKRLLQYAKPYWRKFLVSMAATLALALVEASMAWSIKPITNAMLHNSERLWYVDWLWLFFILCISLRAGMLFLADYTANSISQSIVSTIRNQVFLHLLKLPKKYHDENNIGHSTSLVTYNVALISDFCGRSVMEIIQNLTLVLGLFIALVALSWQLCIISILLSMPVWIVVKQVGKKVKVIQKSTQDSVADINHCLHDNLRSLTMLKLYDFNNYACMRFESLSGSIRNHVLKANRLINLSRVINHLLIATPPAILIYIAINSHISISAGTAVAVFLALMRIQLPLRRLAGYNNLIQQVIIAADDVFTLLKLPVEDDRATNILNGASVSVEFKDVAFAYDNNYVLDNINLEIMAGEHIAIVGHSGSGKSTLLQLLANLYNLNKGEISLNNININDINLENLRNNIAYVSQDDMLLNLSIEKNICFDSKPDLVRLQEATNGACIAGFIDSLPYQYNSEISELAQNISGGQKQRIAIARALYKKAPLLLLDEATAALDQLTEVQVLNNILNTSKATVIMTAHRLSSIINIPKIVVMNAGKIIAIGNHKQLMKSCSVYHNLYTRNHGDA